MTATSTRPTDGMCLSAVQLVIRGASHDAVATELRLANRQASHTLIAAAVRRGLVHRDDLPRIVGRACRPIASLPYTAPDVVARDWRAQAACHAEDVDPEDFHPLGDDWARGDNPQRADNARRICRSRCPVVTECRRDAIAAGDTWAVRGAMTPDERRDWERRNRSAP